MTIEQANEYFSSLPEGFAPAEELRAALTADVQKVQFVGVAGTAGKTAAAGLLAAILREAAFHVGLLPLCTSPTTASPASARKTGTFVLPSTPISDGVPTICVLTVQRKEPGF